MTTYSNEKYFIYYNVDTTPHFEISNNLDVFMKNIDNVFIDENDMFIYNNLEEINKIIQVLRSYPYLRHYTYKDSSNKISPQKWV